MIYKLASDEYRITMMGSPTELTLNAKELRDRLTKDGVWSDVQVDELVSQDVGYETPKVKGIYA